MIIMTNNQRGFSHIEIILVFFAIVVIAGAGYYAFSRSKINSKTSMQSSTQSSPETSSNQTKSNSNSSDSDICEVVSNATFDSVKSYPTESNDPSFVVKSRLKFLPDKNFEISGGDAVYLGKYSCSNNKLEVVSDGTFRTQESNVSWDPETDILKWNGEEYTKVLTTDSR